MAHSTEMEQRDSGPQHSKNRNKEQLLSAELLMWTSWRDHIVTKSSKASGLWKWWQAAPSFRVHGYDTVPRSPEDGNDSRVTAQEDPMKWHDLFSIAGNWGGNPPVKTLDWPLWRLQCQLLLTLLCAACFHPDVELSIYRGWMAGCMHAIDIRLRLTELYRRNISHNMCRI